MRITCPDCKATYEVGDADIPENGIEVECSACLNRWMQMPGVEEADGIPEETAPDVQAPDVSAEIPEIETTPVDEVAPEPEFAPQFAEEPEPISQAVTPEPEPKVAPLVEEEDSVVTNFPTRDFGPIPAWDAPNIAPNEDAATKLRSLLGNGEVSEIESPTDLTDEDFTDLPDLAEELVEEEPAPTVGWRVPKPPESAFLEEDPLDQILAEVNAEAEASAPSWSCR